MGGILIIVKAKVYKFFFTLFYGRIVEEVVSESEPHEETVIRDDEEFKVMVRDVVLDVYTTGGILKGKPKRRLYGKRLPYMKNHLILCPLQEFFDSVNKGEV
ncbi:hypothetical protein ID964_004327 [Salmonella enterica]|nr:hypothetical protein [Salmonella enterica]